MCIDADVCRETIGIRYQSWAAEPRAFIDRPERSFITTDGVWEKVGEKCCNVFIGRCDAWLILCIPRRCNMGPININACPNSHDIEFHSKAQISQLAWCHLEAAKHRTALFQDYVIISFTFINYSQIILTGIKHFCPRITEKVRVFPARLCPCQIGMFYNLTSTHPQKISNWFRINSDIRTIPVCTHDYFYWIHIHHFLV